MARILFVENDLRIDKLGIMYLSAILQAQDHQVFLVLAARKSLDDVMKSFQPDFVMYSVMTGEHEWFIRTNRELKKKFKFVSVMGGPHPTFFPEQGEADPDVDYVVRGPGELVIAQIVNGEETSKVVNGILPCDLDSLPDPDRWLLYTYDGFFDSGIRRFIAARDCKNACAYCFNHIFHREFKAQKQSFFRRISPERMVDQILDVRNRFGLGMTYMNDDNLAEDDDWLFRFCVQYKARVFDPFGIPFCGSVRADSMVEGTAPMMANAGCSFLNIALESSQPDTQKLLRRGRITNDDIIRACNSCKAAGIKVRLQNMIGLPVENPLEDALQTFEFNVSLAPYDSWAAIFQPFPKTDLWKHCLEKGLISEDDQCMNFYDDTILKIPDARKIGDLHKWWHPAVKHSVSRGFLEFLLEMPLTSEQRSGIQSGRWKTAASDLYGDKK